MRIIFSGKVNEVEMTSGHNESDINEEEQPGDFLLATDRLHDCFFVVGNAEQGPTVSEKKSVLYFFKIIFLTQTLFCKRSLNK